MNVLLRFALLLVSLVAFASGCGPISDWPAARGDGPVSDFPPDRAADAGAGPSQTEDGGCPMDAASAFEEPDAATDAGSDAAALCGGAAKDAGAEPRI